MQIADLNEQAKPLTVMVLAHNEERHIAACLDSIFASSPDRDIEVYVVANGCTDNTESTVDAYRGKQPTVKLISIALADKCGAWNYYVHNVIPAECPGRPIFFFMDGDSRAVRGSFAAMAKALHAAPYANAASAVPATGRNMNHYRDEILSSRGQVGNLYALRGGVVERIQKLSARLPIGLEGDDGLIGALIKWDLDPANNEFDDRRIVACADAAFEFDPLSPLRKRDWMTYWKRMVRYGRRRYEFELLGPLLIKKGLAAMPRDISELYTDGASLRLNWEGVYTLSNWVALRQIRKRGRLCGS